MFGTNKVMKQEAEGLPETYWVQELFGTIQGEGPNMGEPAIFLRMAGCNLRCHFCDTDFESSTWRPDPENLFRKFDEVASTLDANLVVITGGEPMRQRITPIINALIEQGYKVQIETAGTLWLDDLPLHYIRAGLLEFVCSPKTGMVNEDLESVCTHWKYIVAADDCDPEDGLPINNTQVPGKINRLYRPRYKGTVWVQPQEAYKTLIQRPGLPPKRVTDSEATAANVKHAAVVAMKYNYRLCIQVHKVVGLP